MQSFEIDPIIHAPARLSIMTVLALTSEVDFLYLLHATGLSKGNLSSHLGKLEQAGYVEIEKTYRGKRPLTLCRLTDAGRKALESYRRNMQTVLDSLEFGDSKAAA